MKSIFSSSSIPVCAAVLCLLGLTGCDDPVARQSAQESSNQVSAIRAEIDAANKNNAANLKQIEQLRTELAAELEAGLKKIQDTVDENHKKVLEQVKSNLKSASESATSLADNARSDNEKELKAAKQLVAENMAAIRAELAAEVDKLRKFMDNQLKETYPYAYQPKRVEPATPPGEQPNEAPKKKEGEGAAEPK